MTVKFDKDAERLTESDRVKYTLFDDYVLLNIQKSERIDEGDYTMTLTNDSGFASSGFHVKVVGKFPKTHYGRSLTLKVNFTVTVAHESCHYMAKV